MALFPGPSKAPQTGLRIIFRFAETLFDPACLDQSVSFSSLALGARYEHSLAIGRSSQLTPRLRVEYEHDLERLGSARVGYSDQTPAQFSVISGYGFDRDRLLLGAGAELSLGRSLALEADYAYRTGPDALGDNSVRLGLTLNF